MQMSTKRSDFFREQKQPLFEQISAAFGCSKSAKKMYCLIEQRKQEGQFAAAPPFFLPNIFFTSFSDLFYTTIISFLQL